MVSSRVLTQHRVIVNSHPRSIKVCRFPSFCENLEAYAALIASLSVSLMSVILVPYSVGILTLGVGIGNMDRTEVSDLCGIAAAKQLISFQVCTYGEYGAVSHGYWKLKSPDSTLTVTNSLRLPTWIVRVVMVCLEHFLTENPSHSFQLGLVVIVVVGLGTS